MSPAGDDGNDGIVHPIKTLKHAIGLAAENTVITTIILASGTYSAAGGETFPYTVPPNVTIVGPAGGGAILAGSDNQPGMTVDSGTLQDLELQDFTIAITATGTARVTNIHIRSSVTAVQAETTAKLTVNNLDITGTTGACNAGIELNGAADLVVTTLSTRSLGVALNAKDQSTSNVTGATLAGDPSCTSPSEIVHVIKVTSVKSFSLSSSLIDGGPSGIFFGAQASPPLQATIENTTLRNLKNDGLDAGGGITLQATGGEFSNIGNTGVSLGGNGTWKFTGVTFSHNAIGLFVEQGTFLIRGCSFTGNGNGISLNLPGVADLGTVADPGNNTLQNSSGVNLDYEASTVQVQAIGNIWNPNVQGADATGKYPTPAVIQGPIAGVDGNNYDMSCDPGQCTLVR